MNSDARTHEILTITLHTASNDINRPEKYFEAVFASASSVISTVKLPDSSRNIPFKNSTTAPHYIVHSCRPIQSYMSYSALQSCIHVHNVSFVHDAGVKRTMSLVQVYGHLYYIITKSAAYLRVREEGALSDATFLPEWNV